ncbi:glycosyltransferase, partial [Schleiferiaceae bacterium]|nr:glycosyltransferase [Schleiferiaceae bacterium]
MGDRYNGNSKKSMIALISLSNGKGGSESYLRNIKASYERNGVEARLIDIYQVSESPPFIKLFSIMRSFLLATRSIVSSDYDIVISSNIYVNSFLCFLRQIGVLRTKKLIIRESTNIFRRYKGRRLLRYKILYRLYRNNFDYLLFQNPIMRLDLLTFLSLSNDDIVKYPVLPNPVDRESLGNLSEDRLDKNLGSYALVVARLIHAKGIDLLIKSWSLIDTDLNLVIVGNGVLRQQLINLTSELGLEHRVFFEGSKKNPFSYMREAECCIISSRIEGFPNVLNEMLALNCRVLCSSALSGIENVNDFITLYDIENPASLLMGIKNLELIEKNPEAQNNRIEYLRNIDVNYYIE